MYVREIDGTLSRFVGMQALEVGITGIENACATGTLCIKIQHKNFQKMCPCQQFRSMWLKFQRNVW